MNRIALIVLTCVCFCGMPRANAQGVPDTARTSMPAIELPEITIVGKKAITLPFARKGEIFDANVYEAAAPDSSFMISRPSLPLPTGEYNRLAERISPWHASVGGGLGNFRTFSGNGFVGATLGIWTLYGTGEYDNTNGYSPARLSPNSVIMENPASSTLMRAGAGVSSILATDNDLLHSLRVWVEAVGERKGYTLFGLDVPVLPGDFSSYYERTATTTRIAGGIGSVQQRGFVFSLAIAARHAAVTDTRKLQLGAAQPPFGDVDATVSSPKLESSVGVDLGRFRLGTSLSFESGSYDYSVTPESPSAIALSSTLQWQPADRMTLSAGLVGGHANGTAGGSRSLLLPTGTLRWQMDGFREFSAWWRPRLSLISYDSVLRSNPYIGREIAVLPSRTPVNLGASFSYSTKSLSFLVAGSYTQTTDRGVVVSANGGSTLGYLDATEAALRMEGSAAIMGGFRISYGGSLVRATADTGDVQLPMVPSLSGFGKAGYDFGALPLSLYIRADYRGKTNTNLTGSGELDPYLLLSAGGSAGLYRGLSLSLDLVNIGNSKYQVWEGYMAAPFQLYASAKWTIQ